MVWLNEFLDKAIAVIAADTTTFANSDRIQVQLIASPFTEVVDLDMGTLVNPTNSGISGRKEGSGAGDVTIDPISGERLIDVPAPAGGWRWETTSVFAGNETIYGYAICIGDGGNPLAVEHFDEPIEVTAAGQVIDIARVRLRLNSGAFA